MEKIIKDIEELKKYYEKDLQELIDEFIENNEEETHVDTILFKKRVIWSQSFISSLNQIINKNTPL